MPDLVLTVNELTAEGDSVSGELTASANGKTAIVQVNSRFTDDKIAEVWFNASDVHVTLALPVVAQDNEEKLFYSLMTAAASYVFRPSDRIIGKAVMRLFGVASPAESNDSE